MLDLKFSKRASKFLESCDNELYKRIMGKIRELLADPYPSDSSKVQGRKDDAQKVRVGGYRIIYAVIKEDNRLFVVDVDKRGRVYG